MEVSTSLPFRAEPKLMGERAVFRETAVPIPAVRHLKVYSEACCNICERAKVSAALRNPENPRTKTGETDKFSIQKHLTPVFVEPYHL